MHFYKDDGETYAVCSLQTSLDGFKLLLELGADVNKHSKICYNGTESDGWPAIFYAAEADNRPVLNFLLDELDRKQEPLPCVQGNRSLHMVR